MSLCRAHEINFVRGSGNILEIILERNCVSRTSALLLSDFATEGSSPQARWGRRERINNPLDQIV